MLDLDGDDGATSLSPEEARRLSRDLAEAAGRATEQGRQFHSEN